MRAFLIDAAGNLAVFGLSYYWLSLPASSTGNLLLSVALAAVIYLLVAYLVAFAFNRDARGAASRVPALAVWLLVVAGLLAAIMPVWGWAEGVGNWLASALTFSTRVPVKPEWLVACFRFLVGGLAGLVMLAALLPVAVRAAQHGGEGLRDWRPVSLTWGYLASAVTWMAIGLWLPWKLFWWIPQFATFEGQMASFAVRAGLAFALYVATWLIFAGYCRAKTLSPER